MTRELRVVDSADASAVLEALRGSLAGGAAILPHTGTPGALPDTVAQRVAIVIETSGSSGRPKRVSLSADALLAGAAASGAELGGPGQWLLALPTHYIAGVNVLVRSIASETQPVVLGPGPFSADAFSASAELLDAPLRFVSLVPAQLAGLLDSDAALEALRRFDRILVGGQAVPTELTARALEAGLNLTRTYGSTETSGGCVWDGVPIGNTEVRIIDGRVEIAGSILAEGYLDDHRRSAYAFREQDGRRWYRTDDTGELPDGILRITGRIDDIIVSGGVKVSLAEVERAVRAQPGLGDAVVVAAPHPRWGETPVVVTTVGVDLDVLRDAIGGRLGAAAAPSRAMLIDVMPMLATGKPDRLALAALALK